LGFYFSARVREEIKVGGEVAGYRGQLFASDPPGGLAER